MTKKRLSYDLGAEYLSDRTDPEEEAAGSSSQQPPPDHSEYARALRSLLEDNLTKKQKCYIILYYRDGLTVKEIAEKYGVDKSTVSRTINRGRQRLTGTLGREVLRRLFTE